MRRGEQFLFADLPSRHLSPDWTNRGGRFMHWTDSPTADCVLCNIPAHIALLSQTKAGAGQNLIFDARTPRVISTQKLKLRRLLPARGKRKFRTNAPELINFCPPCTLQMCRVRRPVCGLCGKGA